MNVGSINSTDYSTIINSAQTGSLENSLSGVNSKDSSDEEMMAACKEFEAYMIEKVYKQVMSTIKSDEEDSSGYADYAYDLQAQQYAKLVSDQGNLGLAQQLYDSMKKNQGVTHIVTQETE